MTTPNPTNMEDTTKDVIVCGCIGNGDRCDNCGTPFNRAMEDTTWELDAIHHLHVSIGLRELDATDEQMSLAQQEYLDFFRKELQLAEERGERKGREEATQELSEYTEHTRNCILSLNHAGRPTEDGGYEHLYGDKWYSSRPIDNTPECECGLSKLLTPPEETNGK